MFSWVYENEFGVLEIDVNALGFEVVSAFGFLYIELNSLASYFSSFSNWNSEPKKKISWNIEITNNESWKFY